MMAKTVESTGASELDAKNRIAKKVLQLFDKAGTLSSPPECKAAASPQPKEATAAGVAVSPGASELKVVPDLSKEAKACTSLDARTVSDKMARPQSHNERDSLLSAAPDDDDDESLTGEEPGEQEQQPSGRKETDAHGERTSEEGTILASVTVPAPGGHAPERRFMSAPASSTASEQGFVSRHASMPASASDAPIGKHAVPTRSDEVDAAPWNHAAGYYSAFWPSYYSRSHPYHSPMYPANSEYSLCSMAASAAVHLPVSMRALCLGQALPNLLNGHGVWSR